MSTVFTEKQIAESNEQEQKPFNPNGHIIQLKSQQGPKDYLPVQWRLVWFRDQYPHGDITTEMLHLDMDKEVEIEVDKWNDSARKYEKVKKIAKGVCVFKATIRDGKGGVATGTKSENAASFADYIEKAETGAIGRALAGLGFGTQFAPELDEGEERIADAPVQRQQRQKPAEELPSDPTIKAANDGLFKAAYQAKQKALKIGAITNDQGWIAMLSGLGITEISTGKDIFAINNKIIEVEKTSKQQSA